MATRIQDLFLIQAAMTVATNEDLSHGIQYLDAAGVPIPLAGISFLAKFKKDPASNAPYLVLASAGMVVNVDVSVPRGLFLTEGGLGVLGFYAPFSQMARRPIAGTYAFDALASADGVTRRVCAGTLTIAQGVT